MRARFLLSVMLVATLAACDSKTDDPNAGGSGGSGATGGTGGSGGSGGAGGTGGGITECGSANVLELTGSPAVLDGMTDSRNSWDGRCAPDLSYGNDVIVRFQAEEAGYYRFSTAGTDVETVLIALDDCMDGFSEFACSYAPGKPSQLTVGMDAGQTIYLVVDTVKEKIPQPFKLTGTKVTDRRPTIDEAVAYANSLRTGSVAVRVSGSNPDADLVGFTFQVFTSGGQPILKKAVSGALQGSRFEVAQGGGTFQVSGVVSLSGSSLPAIGAIELTFVDANGLPTETKKISSRSPETVGHGEACDTELLFNVCGPDLGCVQPAPAGEARCAAAPVITKMTATKNLVAGTWGVVVEGTDLESNVVSARVRPKDARGIVVQVGTSNPTPVSFHKLGQDLTGAFRGVIALEARFEPTCETPAQKAFQACKTKGDKDEATCEAERVQQLATCLAETLDRITKVDVDLVDATGLISRVSSATFADTEPAVVGGDCDPYGAIGYCPAGLVCWSEEDSVPETCQENGPACPSSYGAIDLAGHAAGGGWSFSGSLAGAGLRETASCGGGGKTRVFSFSAPEAGVYSFATSALGTGVDTVLSVRSFCQLSAYELACSDDAVGAGKASRVELELGAGDEVFALVGAKDDVTAGAFTLSVVRED